MLHLLVSGVPKVMECCTLHVFSQKWESASFFQTRGRQSDGGLARFTPSPKRGVAKVKECCSFSHQAMMDGKSDGVLHLFTSRVAKKMDCFPLSCRVAKVMKYFAFSLEVTQKCRSGALVVIREREGGTWHGQGRDTK